MVSPETPAQRAARQLEALMRRHHITNAAEFERMMAKADVEPLISQVTIRRILKAEARTEPEKTTLRRLAEFLGETYAQAFPEPQDEQAVVVEIDGRRIAFRAEDGGPMSPSLAEKIRRLTVDQAHEIHRAKTEHKKRKKA